LALFQDIPTFDPKQITFGRHQTFPLRFGWLTKGFQALGEDDGIFSKDDATVTLGVGRNMVDSIKYWLQAARIVEYRTLQSTDLGKAIFAPDGFDPYLEDEGTLWLIHWLLASNSMMATALYWFFNRYHKPEFTATELQQGLTIFAEDSQSKVSPNTLKQDAAIIVRMYVASAGDKRTPLEEALDSPLALLDLITPHTLGKTYQSRVTERPELPCEILGYAVSELFLAKNATAIPLEELLQGTPQHPSPGSVFRLSENGLLTKLEELVQQYPQYVELRETAGLHQLYKINTKFSPLDLLKHYYTTDTQ
jgi:hypothetical protein